MNDITEGNKSKKYIIHYSEKGILTFAPLFKTMYADSEETAIALFVNGNAKIIIHYIKEEEV